MTTKDRKAIAGPANDLSSASSVVIDRFAVNPDLDCVRGRTGAGSLRRSERRIYGRLQS
ncbi:hypothetical protein [Kribbella capetownensis]|uniref:hypothetical protein n=1 Tax=Kribbella capetownensis TaxID=1572659 RepID=UPI0013F4B856|nr:hypothetical protein [Kribbella capetownensis]